MMAIILLFNYYHIVIKKIVSVRIAPQQFLLSIIQQKLKKKFFGDRFKIKEIRYVCNAYTCDDAH